MGRVVPTAAASTRPCQALGRDATGCFIAPAVAVAMMADAALLMLCANSTSCKDCSLCKAIASSRERVVARAMGLPAPPVFQRGGQSSLARRQPIAPPRRLHASGTLPCVHVLGQVELLQQLCKLRVLRQQQGWGSAVRCAQLLRGAGTGAGAGGGHAALPAVLRPCRLNVHAGRPVR